MAAPRSALSLVALTLVFASIPIGAADDEFLPNLHAQYKSMICTESLRSCANVAPASCNALVSEALSACPSDRVESAMANALQSEEAEDKALNEVEAYSSCFGNKFLELTRSRDINDNCVVSALEESAKKRREGYRIENEVDSAR